ncbi:MAG: sulfurtransferase [SAR202 cluster bacterium]|nr:sulfurtransferase [SAR202 cluster bacterium]
MKHTTTVPVLSVCGMCNKRGTVNQSFNNQGENKLNKLKGITKILIAAGISVAVFALLACSTSDSGPSTSDDSAVAAKGYKNPDRIVSVAWLNKHINDENLVIVDVRSLTEGEPVKYNEGHIPGAINIPANTTFQQTVDGVKGMLPSAAHIEGVLSDHGVKATDTIIFYDDIKSLWASRALWGMDVYGHKDSKLLDGDINLWIAKGYATSQETATLAKSNYKFSGSPNTELIVDLDTVAKSIEGKAEVLDTRSSDEYVGKNLRGNARGGHIPGSVLVEWKQNAAEDGSFLPAKDLKDLYASVNIVSGDEIYTLCQTAVRATHSWFVLSELLGYPNISVYDGSAIEYANREDTALEIR